MLTLEKQNYLHNLEQFEGMSIRGIAKKTGHHFNTVKKYVDMNDWNKEYMKKKGYGSRLDPLKPTIDEWLKEDIKRKRKYRRTATKIFKDLRDDKELGPLLTVGMQTVINYVAKRKKELLHDTYGTAMYAEHSMCYAQVDFGEILVQGKKGEEETLNMLVLSFPWSNAGFGQVCTHQTKECLCEALQQIFEYIGGVPLRILFDNMSSAVIHIEENGKRTLTEMFMRFTMHHRFKADFCNPNSPNEKGNVENKVGYLRRNLLLPPPHIDDIRMFNEDLLKKCSLDLAREHYLKTEKISTLFALEQEALISLPREKFRVFKLEKVRTDKYSFIHFENNRYSTSPEYAEAELWLEIGTFELRVLNEKYECIAVHQRKYNKDFEPSIDFENYINTLSKKPRAFMNSPYFNTLPESVKNHLKKCQYQELRKMLLTLVPIIKADKIEDAAAVLELMDIQNCDDFLMAYRALTDDTMPLNCVVTELTPSQKPYMPKLKAYSAIIGGDR